MEIVVLGSGPSSSVPAIKCLLSGSPCSVCVDAHNNVHDPLTEFQNKNIRGNPSILVSSGNHSVLIDCGKTFRTSMLHLLKSKKGQKNNSLNIAHVLLTHGHADACFGLDDLRDLQKWTTRINPTTGEKEKLEPVPIQIYANYPTLCEMKTKFDYLFPEYIRQDEPYRWKASLTWHQLTNYVSISVGDLEITPIPVKHGEDIECLGYDIRNSTGKRLVYLSDVSRIPDRTMKVLQGDIDLFMIDTLSKSYTHTTHLNLKQSAEIIKQLNPKKTLLTGMSHDLDYYDLNAKIIDKGIQMAFDGQEIYL